MSIPFFNFFKISSLNFYKNKYSRFPTAFLIFKDSRGRLSLRSQHQIRRQICRDDHNVFEENLRLAKQSPSGRRGSRCGSVALVVPATRCVAFHYARVATLRRPLPILIPRVSKSLEKTLILWYNQSKRNLSGDKNGITENIRTNQCRFYTP